MFCLVKCFVVCVVLFSSIGLFNPCLAAQSPLVDVYNIRKLMDGKKYALVIGINQYSTMPLEAAVNDARSVSERLEQLNFNVTTLLDSQATIKNIRHELGTKLVRTNSNDQIVIYFAGHGVTAQLHSSKMIGYILPVNANLKDLYSTAISMKELRDLTLRIPAKHILFVFDSCYSGLGLTRSANIAAGAKDKQKYFESLAGKRGVYMITAGKADEVAREFRGHGLFTLHFLDGIAGAADSSPQDGIVQASELGMYLAKKVSVETESAQNPQHGLIEGDGDFLFPLADDDPIRLRKSLLSHLTVQSKEILKRISIQDELEKYQSHIEQIEKNDMDEYDRKISKLDEQIKNKKREIESLNLDISHSAKGVGSREQYNIMKFLNTGVEIDILKIFPDQNAAKDYFINALGYRGSKKFRLYQYQRWVPLTVKESLKNKNSYLTKVSSYTSKYDNEHWLRSLDYAGYKQKDYDYEISSGYVDYVKIKSITPSTILSKLSVVDSPLQRDKTTYIEGVTYRINSITSNEKLLLFDQFSNRMIARYGQPTSYGNELRIENWKIGRKQKYRSLIWEDKYVKLVLWGEYSSISISIKNKSKVFAEIKKHAISLCEAEQLILLKQRIQKMADLERSKTQKAQNLSF